MFLALAVAAVEGSVEHTEEVAEAEVMDINRTVQGAGMFLLFPSH